MVSVVWYSSVEATIENYTVKMTKPKYILNVFARQGYAYAKRMVEVLSRAYNDQHAGHIFGHILLRKIYIQHILLKRTYITQRHIFGHVLLKICILTDIYC